MVKTNKKTATKKSTTAVKASVKKTSVNTIYDDFIGKECILRSDGAGVFLATVDGLDDAGKTAKISKVRKTWYWDGACAVEELSKNGVQKPDNCNFTVTVKSMIITGVVQILIATPEAIASIRAVKDWKSKKD